MFTRGYTPALDEPPNAATKKKVNPMAGEVTTEGGKKRSCRSSHNRAGVLRSWCRCQLGGLKTMIAWVAWMDDTFPSFFLFSNLPYVSCFFMGIILKANVCHVAHLHFWHLFLSFHDAR